MHVMYYGQNLGIYLSYSSSYKSIQSGQNIFILVQDINTEVYHNANSLITKSQLKWRFWAIRLKLI